MSISQTQPLVMNTTTSPANNTIMLSWTEESSNTTVVDMMTTQQPGYVSVLDTGITDVSATNMTNFTDTGQTDLEKVADNWGYFWLLLLPLCSVGGNMAVILVVHRSPRLHTLLYYLLASLAGAHMMTALLVAPLALATELLESFPLSQGLCRAWLAVDAVLILTGLTHLGLAVYSCRVALLRPLRYKLRAAVRYIACQIGLAWGLALVLATPFIVVISVVDVEEDKSFRGCEPWQVEHTLARVLPAFYIPLVVLCGLYVWTLQTAKSRTALALQLAEATGTANSSTSNGDVTGLDRLDTEFYTMQENGEPSGDSFLVWHQARLEAKAVEESNKMNGVEQTSGSPTTPKSSPRLNAHSIVTTKPSTSSGELSPIYPNNGQLDSHHLGVDPFLKIDTEEVETYPPVNETDNSLPKTEDSNPTEIREEQRRDSLQCPPIIRKDTLDCITSVSQNEEASTAALTHKSDEKLDANESSSQGPTLSSEHSSQQQKSHKAQRPTELPMPEVTQSTVDYSGSAAGDILSPRTVGACESILRALEGNDDEQEMSPTLPTEPTGDLVSTSDKQPTIDAADEAVEDDDAQKESLHKTASSDSTTSVRSQGRASKEQLNEPLEEKDILLELEQDTQHLLADNPVPDSLSGVVNPAFDHCKDDLSPLETDSLQEGGSENGDMPLCNAIRVKHDVQEKNGGEGDEKTGEEEPNAKNAEGSRRSSVSGGSGFSGPRRSILRRDGSKRGASTKSVKFSNKVETKVLTKEKSLSAKKTPNSRKGKSIAHKPSSKTAKKQKNKEKKETSDTSDSQDQENKTQSSQNDTKDIEKDPGQYQVIHRGRVANGSLRNPHRMRLTNGKLVISGTGGVDGEVVVDYLAEVQRRQGVRICRRVREQQDALQMLAIMFGAYLILLLPHHVLHTVLGICDTCRDDVSDTLVTAFRWLALSTCAINPLLYCLVSVTFRRSLDKACCRCCCNCCCCCCPSP